LGAAHGQTAGSSTYVQEFIGIFPELTKANQARQ